MILADDLLIKPFFSMLDIVHSMVLDELYDVESLQDELKENQLLYELGERPADAYERRKAELERELDAARNVREKLSHSNVEVH
jgi:hypothetical protein